MSTEVCKKCGNNDLNASSNKQACNDYRHSSGINADAIRILITLTSVYSVNVADRFLVSVLIEPIKAEFALSDSGVAFLAGVSMAVLYVSSGIPLGVLADRVNRRNMVAAALAVWSFFTLLCGLATSYWQLFLARTFVGVGEAGGTPPSQSMLADCFEPRARGLAMSIFALGVPIGSAIGTGCAGWIAAHYGWRASLLAFGIAGLPIALWVRFGIDEPRRGARDPRQASHETLGLKNAIQFMVTSRSIRHLSMGMTLFTFAGNGLVWWTPAFLERSHGLSLGQASAALGLMNGIGGTMAILATIGVMAFMASRELHWQGIFVAISLALAALFGTIAYSTASTETCLRALWIFVPLSVVYVGPSLALLQSLVPAGMRGQSVAILLFTTNVAHLIIAPQLVGFLSDLVASHISQPRDALGIVLALTALAGFWAAGHYLVAARALAGLSRSPGSPGARRAGETIPVDRRP